MSMKTMPVPQARRVTLNNPDEDGSVTVSEDDHLSSLKALTEKLHLETKRSSHMQWRFQSESQRPKPLETTVTVKEAQIRPWSSLKWTKSSVDFPINKLQRHPSERLKGFGSMTEALEWLRKELTEMRVQDQHLALQLIHLHGDVNKLKIEQACKQHRKMLNDATFELEERYELLDLLCDVPITSGFGLCTPLKLIGITKMNISSRRFSLC